MTKMKNSKELVNDTSYDVPRHCEERSDEAIHSIDCRVGLRCACPPRNDEYRGTSGRALTSGCNTRELVNNRNPLQIGRGKREEFPLLVERVRERVGFNHSDTPQSLISSNHFTHFTHLKKNATQIIRGAAKARFCSTLRAGLADARTAPYRKFGFTLAEVLITLGVIGIVAAMTIPNLVQNYQSKAWNTADTVFQRKLTEALKIMNTQGTLAGYSTTEAFVNELSKHLKITKTCINNLTSCFEKEVTVDGKTTTIKDTQTAQDLGKNWGTNVVGFQLANGVNGLLAYNPDCTQDEYSNQITGSDCLGVVYDTSAYAKPNEHLKDIRTNGNVKKLGDEWICLRFADHCWTVSAADTPLSYADCKEHQEELGITYCRGENDDYWGGAVKKCGGVDKLPTTEQLADLASAIYGQEMEAKSNYDNLTIKDQELFESLHSKSLSASKSYFYVWSREEVSSALSYSPYFGDTTLHYNHAYRGGNADLAVCLGD